MAVVDGSYFILPNKTTRFKNVVYKLIYPHQSKYKLNAHYFIYLFLKYKLIFLDEKSLLKLVSEKLFNDSKVKSE